MFCLFQVASILIPNFLVISKVLLYVCQGIAKECDFLLQRVWTRTCTLWQWLQAKNLAKNSPSHCQAFNPKKALKLENIVQSFRNLYLDSHGPSITFLWKATRRVCLTKHVHIKAIHRYCILYSSMVYWLLERNAPEYLDFYNFTAWHARRSTFALQSRLTKYSFGLLYS